MTKVKQQLDTRDALIHSGIKLFGDYGLKGTSTRMLSQDSGANIALISYHFGNKEGLYEACIDYIALRIQEYIKDTYINLGDIIRKDHPTPSEAKQVIDSIIDTMLTMFIIHDEPKAWNALISREQTNPTPAFDIIYDSIIKRIQHDLTRMIAVYIGRNPKSEESKVRGHIFISQVLGFITSRESFLRHMETENLSQEQIKKTRDVLKEYIDTVLNGLQSTQQKEVG